MWLHFLLMGGLIVLGVVLYYNGKNNVKDNIYLFISFGVFNFLVANRAVTVGNDTMTYATLFNTISKSNIDTLEMRYEKGFIYLNKILSFIWDDPQILFITASLIVMISFGVYIKRYSQNIWLSVMLFFTFGYYSGSNNTIRQFIAISIILWSYEYIFKRKLIKFIIVVLIASQFHSTAIIFLAAYPLSRLKLNKKNTLFLLGGAGVGYIAFDIIFQLFLNVFPVYSYYIGSEYMTGDIRLASVMNFLVLVIIGLLYWITKDNKKIKIVNSNTANILEIYMLISILLTFISFKFNLIERCAEYFTVSILIILPNTITRLKEKNLKITVYILATIFFMLYATTILIYRPEWNKIYPYNFFWQ